MEALHRSVKPQNSDLNTFIMPPTLKMLVGHIAFGLSMCHTFFYYTPPHKKWQGIMLYPPNFECPSVVRQPLCLSVRLSVCLSALRFRALTLVPFDRFSSNFA